MESVFLSYDHKDTDRVRPIALALEKAGHVIWWDSHIRGGAEYAKEIERALKRAESVVVLWSVHSIESAWVRDEAAVGRDSGRLVPALIDAVEPPLGFRQLQHIDLSRWNGRARAPEFKQLLNAISACHETDEPAVHSQAVSPAALPPAAKPRGVLVTILAAALLLITTVVGWRWFQKPSSAPVVAVVAADDSPVTGTLARNLLVKLGSLRAARTDVLRLVGAGEKQSGSADLVFEAASGSTDPGVPRASLTLLEGKGRAVLWSKDFEAPGGSRPALEQSMAYTAGQVLDCALEANAGRTRVDEQTQKLFLNGCALFGERYRSDPKSVVPIFTQVVERAPEFQPAWSKLLLAEAQNTRGQMLFFDRFEPGSLPQHIRAARKLNPRLPELYLAEIALLPLSALDERLRLIDEAIRLHPDNPDLRTSRSEFLSSVGRNGDAVEDAKRAAELNPLSAGFRSNVIQMLTYSGQLAAAEEDLRRAEQLWPGSPTIEDARFRFASRYGDAREAQRMLQSPDFKQYYSTQEMPAYIRARLDPTQENITAAIAASQSPQLAKPRRWVQLIQLLADFGRNDEIYGLLMGMTRDEARLVSSVLYRPAFVKFRQDPRFMEIMAHADLIGFWSRSGKWPDFCFEEDLPYDCKAEAAKLKKSMTPRR